MDSELRIGHRPIGRRIGAAATDAAGIAGGAAVAYGAWLAYEPAGYIVGGILLLAAAVLGGRAIG